MSHSLNHIEDIMADDRELLVKLVKQNNTIVDYLKQLELDIVEDYEASVMSEYSEEEKKKMMQLKETGRYFELTERMKDIVHVDLRMVDVSDFLIIYLDLDVGMFGTIHELLNSLAQRKPTLVVINGGRARAPNWLFGIMDYNFMFDSFDDLQIFLNQINDGTIGGDLSRWVFFSNNEEE